MTRQKSIRHIIIFYAGMMMLAISGGVLMASGQEIGGLLFILSPILMVLVVRILLRDGWQDAGLRPKFKQSWQWYLFSLLIYFGSIGINGVDKC